MIVNANVLCTLNLLREEILNVLIINTHTHTYIHKDSYEVIDVFTNLSVIIISNIYIYQIITRIP